MSGRSYSGWNVVNAIVVIVVLIIGLALLIVASMSQTRGSGSRRLKNTTQIRGITQGIITYAGSNKGYYPGLNSKGQVLPDSDRWTGLSGTGMTAEARIWILLDENAFTGEYAISPIETKTNWTTGAVTAANYSYALLELEGEVGKQLDAGRGDEWRSDTLRYEAIVISDRNTGPNAYAARQSIHMPYPGKWEGAIGRNDGSASYETTHLQDTQYGKTGPLHIDDNIFDAAGDDDAYMIYTGE